MWSHVVWEKLAGGRPTNKEMPLVIQFWRFSPQIRRQASTILHKHVDNSLHKGWVWWGNCAGQTPEKRSWAGTAHRKPRTRRMYCRSNDVMAREMVRLLRVVNGYESDRMRLLRVQSYFPHIRMQKIKYPNKVRGFDSPWGHRIFELMQSF
jgi:hypothetical protein